MKQNLSPVAPRMRLAPRSVAAAFAAGLALMTVAGQALAAPAWITIGEKAHAVLAQVAPEQARTLSSTKVAVTLPERRGSLKLKAGSETVYAVEVDDEVLPALSEAVHEQLRRCGGFVQHRSMAEALAVLNRLNRPVARGELVAPSYAIDNQALVQSMLSQPQASNILSTIQQLSNFQNRRYNSTHGVAASNWLFNQWAAMAPNRRDVQVRQITHAGYPQKSVTLDIIGTTNSGEVIVIGGHLDSIAGGGVETSRAPGADDDASGIASLTEVIRVLIANNYQPKRTLRFIGYAAEEAGLRGSGDIVASQAFKRERVVGVMQLDMTAYRGDATDLWLYTDYTNAAQNQFLAALAAAYLPQLSVGYDACGYGCSDHASWHNGGYIASFPFEAADATYNPFIHTANDTIATFGGTANHALKFSLLALTYALELGSDGPN